MNHTFRLVLALSIMLPAASAFAQNAPSSPQGKNSAGENPPGSKFKFYGTGANAADPQNPDNDVVSIDTTDPSRYGGMFRTFGDHVKVEQLTNQLGLKYYLVGRTCAGGSPRLSIFIAPTGNPKDDLRAVYGYVGTGAFGGGCPSNTWVYQDLSQGPQWDLQSQYGQGYGNTWAQVVAYFDTNYPDHRVVYGYLDDDSAGFAPTTIGCAYYDLVSIGVRTFTNHDDASGKGTNNTCP